MNSRLEEVEELLKENLKRINGWLWNNHFSKEQPPPEMRMLIDDKVKLEIEKDRLTRT